MYLTTPHEIKTMKNDKRIVNEKCNPKTLLRRSLFSITTFDHIGTQFSTISKIIHKFEHGLKFIYVCTDVFVFLIIT